MKITEKMVDRQIEILNENLGRPLTSYKKVGKEYVPQPGNFSYNSFKPGNKRLYSLEEVDPRGGVNHPFFTDSLPIKEFFDRLVIINNVLYRIKKGDIKIPVS